MSRSFLILRHGETAWNAELRMQGQLAHIPLNDVGCEQAKAAAAKLDATAVDVILSSPLERTAQTAHIIAQALHHIPVVYDDRLIERKFGVAEGLTLQEIEAANPDAFFENAHEIDPFFRRPLPKGAETAQALELRAKNALFDLLARHSAERLLVVSHGAWIKALIHSLTGKLTSIPNAMPYRAEERRGAWQFQALDRP